MFNNFFELPFGWIWVKTGDICEGIVPGRTKPKKFGGTIPWITLPDIINLYITKSHNNLAVFREDAEEVGMRVMPKGTVLMSCVGQFGIIGIAVNEVVPNQQLHGFVCLDNISPKFLAYSLLAQVEQMENLASATTISYLNKTKCNSIQIPLPPLKEQKRIVTKIEALQTRSSAVKEELEAIKPLLDQFRQSVLASAFRGDLTKDWRSQNPDVEPAEVLLERIRVERRRRWEEAELEKMKAKGKVPKDDKWKKKYKEPQPIDTEGLLGLPDGWYWVGFEKIATVASNLVSPENYLDYPHIAPDNIEKGSGKLLEFKTIQEDKVISPKHLFYPGQILYSKIRPYLSKCVLINFQGLCSADMYPINSDIDTAYLFRFILSNTFLKLINKASGSRVVLPKANQKQVYSIPVPVPPFKEQKEIVRRIESLFKLADNIEQQYQQAEVDLETLNQSILAKAFRGELVPQDPNDEPASVLLERIKEERDKAKATAKKSKTKKTKKRSSKKKDEQLGIPGM